MRLSRKHQVGRAGQDHFDGEVAAMVERVVIHR
jgi:hypothetical protein